MFFSRFRFPMLQQNPVPQQPHLCRWPHPPALEDAGGVSSSSRDAQCWFQRAYTPGFRAPMYHVRFLDDNQNSTSRPRHLQRTGRLFRRGA